MLSKERIMLGVALALALTALAAGISATVSSLVQTNQTISNIGSVKGIGVGIYWDPACTNRISSINWGLLDPGSSKNVTLYIRNEGNTVATLSKATQNWNPTTASNYMTLNWNYAGQALNANQVMQLRLSLVISTTVTGLTNFSFDIMIIASG